MTAPAAPGRRRRPRRRADFDYAGDVEAALYQGPRLATHLLLLAIAALFGSGIAWASWATVEEVTRGSGRVIPSRQIQVVQTLEPGIVEEILVAEGELVELGQVLVRIDDTGFSSELGELHAQRAALRAAIARLTAEVTGEAEIDFPADLEEESLEVIVDERSLFEARRRELDSQLAILRQQAEQREQELEELRGTAEQQEGSLALARQELGVYSGLSAGVVPQVEILRLRREVNDLEGALEGTRRAIPRVESSIREAYERIEDQYLGFRAEAQREMNQRRAELAVITQSLRAAQDRVTRADIRSPVNGIVNRLNVNTVGGVVHPGMTIVEIVPLEDSLLVEAQIRPSDVAFLRPGMAATVKITAYDYAIYGGLQGAVERISADTITDEETGESFYRVIVRTDETHLGTAANPLPIIPGMIASVDILTGEKTVLDYLLKPLVRARSEALRER